jgi:ATP-dependent protease HslVU (ClpYQ) ATPase subunit
MKQTVVEFLAEKLESITQDLFNQAKEMEKQQIIEAYHKAQLSLIEVVIESFKPNEKNDLDDKNDAEQYYNETYSK